MSKENFQINTTRRELSANTIVERIAIPERIRPEVARKEYRLNYVPPEEKFKRLKVGGKWIFPPGWENDAARAARFYTYCLETVAAFLAFMVAGKLSALYGTVEGGLWVLFSGTLAQAYLSLLMFLLAGFCAGNIIAAAETSRGSFIGRLALGASLLSLGIGAVLTVGTLFSFFTMNLAVIIPFLFYVLGVAIGSLNTVRRRGKPGERT